MPASYFMVFLYNVKCLIADAPDTGITQLFKDATGNTFKKHRERILSCLYERFYKEFSVDVSDLDRARNVKKGKYPLLLSAGSNEHMEDRLSVLTEHYPQDSVVLILPGCNHGNGMYKQTEMYQSAIIKFIGMHMDI